MHNAEGKINSDSSSSLQSDGFFGLDKIYFYYIDNVENNNSSSVNKVVYSQNSYKDLINKMSENEENIVKIGVPSSSKVCSVSDEITEELLKQKKEEGFDIIIYDNNGEKSFVILNEDIIEEKDILNKSEAVEDCAKEEKKYEEIIKSLFGEKTEKVEKTEKELIVTEEMKKTREKLVKQMQMLGLLDIDETIDYTELEEASDKVSDTKININSGYLIQAINMLSNMDTGAVEINNDTSIFDKLDSLELKCDTSFIEEFKKNIEDVYKISSQGVESGLIQSYLTRLQSLRSSLASMNPDYSYAESVNYLLNMGEFAVDLDWSDEEIKEKAEEVGKNAKKVIYGKMNNVNGISKRNLYSKQNFSLYNDEAEEAKIILKDIDTLVAMNVDRTSNIAYKVALHIELTENEKITYGKKRNDDGFKELLGKYEEASFDIASRKVNFGEPTEKELEIYNDEGNRSKYSEIYTRDISIQYLNISSIPEEERTEEQKKFLSANQSTILKYGEKVWNKYDIDSVDNSSEVNGILTLRADSLNLSADNITSLFGASANKNVNNSPYDRMSDGELYIINAFATIKLGKTIEMMQPALEREDQRKRLGAYKNVKDYYYGNFSAGTYINGEIDDNGTPIYGFGDQISEETKESLFRRNLGNSWATDMWCGYYYDDEAYYENVHVLNNSNKYDKPTVSEYKLLLSKEKDLKRTAGYDKETIKKCNEDYVKYKTVILDSKATLILRTPEDKRTDDENDFLIERDQFKIGLETEKIGKEIAKNSKELETLEETWGSTFEGLEKELKKYAKQKLGYGDKQLTAKDLEIVLEKYLNDPSTKSIKIKGAKKINSGAVVYSTVSLLVDALKRNNKGELDAKENKELILSAFKRRNELNQEQIKLSDKTAALQDVNLSLYSLYSNYDDNKAARIKKVEIKNVGTTFGQKFVYAYDENGNIIDITMADLAIYCKNNNQSELITNASIFNGPKLYCVGSDGQAKYLGHSVDVEDTITGINYHPNGDEYFGLISYLANMDAVNGTTIASTAAVEIADMGKRIEGARIAKERQEKLDTASENIGKVCLYLIAGPLGVAIDKINDNKASDHVGHFVTTVGSGLEDGVVQFGRGLYYAFGGADGKVSADDYARMYFAQGLLDNYGSFYQGTYEVCTSIGNMLPTVALTAIATAITVGTGGAAAPALAAFLKTSATVLMGVSAGGNSIEQGLQEGMTLAQALVYGTLSGASEALLEKFLGGIPGLSNTPNLGAKLFSSIGESILGKELVLKIASSSVVQLIHEMASEALEEGLQEILDPVFKAMLGREWEGIDWEAVGKSAFYGALTAGIMQGSGSMINSTTSTLLTGTSKGLNIALNQTLSQNNGGLINNFDIFKNNIEAIRQHSGSFELIKANLKVDANIKAKYEAYKSLYTNNISAFEMSEFMTFDQFVENLTYSSIIGLNSSESNMGIFKKRFIELTEKLNNINSKLESENDVNKIEKIKLEKVDIVKQLVQTTNQINQCRKLIGLNNNYYEAASIFSDSILASVYETIMEKQGKVEGLNEEINGEKSRVRLAENGEIIRDSVEEVTVEEMQQEGIPAFTSPSESEATNIVESEEVDKNNENIESLEENIYEYRFYSDKVADFYKRNGIIPSEIRKKVDTKIYQPSRISEIIDYYGHYKNAETKTVSIANIIGSGNLKLSVSDIYEVLGEFFGGKIAHSYDSRSDSNLEKSVDEMLSSNSFIREPMRIQNMSTDPNNPIYMISSNGMHRFVSLRALYLHELSNNLENINQLNSKYSIQAEVTEIDAVKTFSHYILSKFSNVKDLSLEYLKDSDGYRIGLSGNSIIYVNGQEIVVSDDQLISMVKDAIEKNRDTLLNYDIYKNEKEYIKFIHDLGYKMSNEVATLEEKQNILINSTKNSFKSFLENDTNGKVLSLFDEEGCKLLEKSDLLYDRLGYVFAFSNYINELIKNEKFIELTVKSLSYLHFENLSIESKNYLLNKCIEMKMGNDTFVQIFNKFDTNFQLELLDNWKYSEELKCCVFDTSNIDVMNKMLQEHSVDILSENINIVRMFEKAKGKIDIPADYITKELAQKIIEECKGNIFEIRNAINNASYSTDTTILEEYLRNYEKNLILSIQNNSLISEYNEVFEAFKKFKSFEEDTTEWYDAWRTYLRILRKSPLAEEGQIFNIENSVDEVFETIKKANDEYVCNLIIDSTFGDNYYNIALNLGELLNFYYQGHIKLSQDKVSLYTKVLNMDTLSSNELIELYNQLNEVSIQEMFYNDISNARLIMREKIKEKSLDFSEMQKYKDEELSKKYGVDVYKIDHDNFYAIVKTGRHVSDSMPTGHSYSLIGNGKFNVYGNVEDANTFVYDVSGLNPDQIVHVYPRDSFTFYRPFENSMEATDRINNLLMPEDLLGNTLGYNELLILEQGSKATGLDEDIKELKKMALYCVDDISQQAVDVAKSQGVGIFFVDTKTYDAQIEQSNDTYHSELNYWDYTYYNKNDLPKIKQEIVKIKEKINSMSKSVKFNLENKLKEKFGEFRDYIYGIKTLNAEEAAQYFDLDYSEYLFNNYKIDPFNPETEIRNILQHIDFSKIFSSFDSGVSKIQDYLLRFMINNNVLNINSLTKNMSVELAINYFGNIYLENEKIKFTDILNCLPSDAILPFVVKFKNNLSDEEICNFIRQIHDSSYSAFSYESQHQVIFDDELVKKLFEIDVIHDYLIRRIGSRYFYGLVESYNLPSELLIQRELLLKSVLNNADSYSFSEIRETIADLYFHNGVLPVKLDLETILFMANKDITFRNEILGDDYLYLSKLYNYFTNDIDFRNLDLDLSKGKEMIEKYFSQCQDRFKDLIVEKIEQNPTENLTPEILVSSNGKNVRVYSLENQTETQKHFTFLVSTINPNSEYIKAQDAIDFKEKYYSSQNIEAFKGYRSCSLINEQSLEYIFSPYRGIVFGYTNLDGRNIISANYGDARTDNPNFVKYGRVNKSNFDTIESFIEHTQRWNEITVSKAENINAMQPSYIYVTSAPTQFQIDVAAEFGIPIIYVNKESYMQQKMLPRENASYYGWGEDFIKTTKIENDLLTNIQPKVSVEDFRNKKSDLSELIDEVAKYDSIEEMFKSDEMKKIKKITDLLLSSDLSSIPSSEWGKIYLIPSNATDIENIHLDFSKTHANIDFSNFNLIYKTADFRGCNIENPENISRSDVIDCVFDSSVIESHRNIFLSDLFDSSFKEKFYKGYLQISDLVELSEAQLDELQKSKYLSDHFPYYKNDAEGKISLKQAVEIFKKYGNEIADKLMYNDFLIKDLLNKNYHPFFEEYSSYITRYGKLFQFAERYGYQNFWQFVENNIDIISGMDSDKKVQLNDLNPIFTDDIESSFEATFKKLVFDKGWIELPEYAIKRGYHIEFYKDYHQFLDSDSKTIFRPIVYQESLINLNEIDKNLIIDIINHYKDMDPNYDKIDFGIFIEDPYILHYFVEKNTFTERYDFLSDSAALFCYQRCKDNTILYLENYIKSHVGTKPLSIAEFQEYAKEFNKEDGRCALRPILYFFDTGDDEYVDHIKKNLEKLLEIRPGLDVYSNPCLCTAILEDSFIDKYGFKTISDLLEYNTSAYKILIDKEKSHDPLVKKWINYLNSLPNYNIKMLHYGICGYDSSKNLINSIVESNIILDNNQLFTLFQILKRNNPFKVENIYQLDHYFQHRNEVLKDMINSEEIEDVIKGIRQALFATSFGDSGFYYEAGLYSEEYVKYLYESEIIDGVDLTCIELINQLLYEKDISRLKFVYNEFCDQGIIFDFDQLENKLKKYYSKQIRDSLFKDPGVDSEGIEHYYINGIDDTSIKNKDGEPMTSNDKIPVVKLKGIKFKLLIHGLWSGNDPNFVSYRDKLIKDPSLWNKLDGASTISTSLISERSNPTPLSGVYYGFSEISENSLVSMGADDINLSHGYGVLDPRGQRYVYYSTPDVLISRTKGSLNEVGLYRKSSDSNEYDHRLQPTCIVCSDYSINTESIRAAQYFKIPIYVIDGTYYSDYDNKIYEQYNSLGKTISDISDIENIMYSKKPIKDKCNLVIKLLDEGKANKSITSQKYVELLTECRKIVCMYPIGNDRVLVSELDNKISTAKRDLDQ